MDYDPIIEELKRQREHYTLMVQLYRKNNNHSGADIHQKDLDEVNRHLMVFEDLLKAKEDKYFNSQISVNYLLENHPELTHEEAYDLMLFSMANTIIFKECYGDGSIMYPLWQEAKRIT